MNNSVFEETLLNLQEVVQQAISFLEEFMARPFSRIYKLRARIASSQFQWRLPCIDFFKVNVDVVAKDGKAAT